MYVSISTEQLQAVLPTLAAAIKRIDARLESEIGAVNYQAPASVIEGAAEPEAYNYSGPAIIVRSEFLDVDEINKRLSNEEDWLLRQAQSKTAAEALFFYPGEDDSVGIAVCVSE